MQQTVKAACLCAFAALLAPAAALSATPLSRSGAAAAAASRAKQLSIAQQQQQQARNAKQEPSDSDDGGQVLSPRSYVAVQQASRPASRSADVRMSDTDDMSSVDPNFGGDELSRTWERTGKGKPRWKPGDQTGDVQMDKRLLYSNWVLNPMALHVRDGCSQSSAARLVMGWLKLPFKVVPGEGSVRLSGSGVPGGPDGLSTFGEICSFASAVSMSNEALSVAPATGRVDVAEWLAAPSIATFRALLRGRQPDDAIPCLNEWGLSMDDASVLPVLKVLLSTCDEDDEGLLDVRDYLTHNYEKAGVEL